MQINTVPAAPRPSLALFGAEPWRAAIEYITHKIGPGSPLPTGDGHPVVIFPGLGTAGSAVAPLRNHLPTLGYAAFDWGQGFNTGPRGNVDQWLAALAAAVIRNWRIARCMVSALLAVGAVRRHLPVLADGDLALSSLVCLYRPPGLLSKETPCTESMPAAPRSV
jgi:hypothetical protein